MRGKTPIFPVGPLKNFSVLFQVDVPFTYGPTIRPIALATAEPAAGVLAVVSGWGVLSDGDTTFQSQLEAIQPSISARAACNTIYTPDHGGITANMICAAGTGVAICNGDFGGPLVVNGILVGIASWGYGCADAQYPDVYTNVVKYKSFVTEITSLS
jgi:trypsin